MNRMKVEVDEKKIKVAPKHDKNCKSSKINDLNEFAFCNSQAGFFKDLLSVSLVRPSSNPIQFLTLISYTIPNMQFISLMLFANFLSLLQKHAAASKQG